MSGFFMVPKSTDGLNRLPGLATSDQIALAALGFSAIALLSQAAQWQLNLVGAAATGGIGLLLLREGPWRWIKDRAIGGWSAILLTLVAALFITAAVNQFLQGQAVREKEQVAATIVGSAKLQIELFKDPTDTARESDLEKYYLPEGEGGDVLQVIKDGLANLRADGQRFDSSASVVVRVDMGGIELSDGGNTATAAAAEVWRMPVVDARTGEEVERPKHPRYMEHAASPYELQKTSAGWRIRHNPSP